MHAIRLALTYLRIGVSNELQYRVNFFIQILQSLISLAVGLIGLALVFNYTNDLNGWTQPELLAVMGIFILMGGVIRAAIQPNMQRLMDEIREGTLDFALAKPVDSQLIASVREFRFWQLVDVVLGFVIIGIAVVRLHESLSLLDILAFVAALLMGAVMIYCFWLMLTTTAFWVVRVDEMVNLFEGVYAAGRWPVTVYPQWLRLILTFIIPVAFAVTIPAEALTGRLTALTLLGALALTVLLATLARFIWRRGVKAYSGASA
jgi:ABC-2 type transport system permease protein